MPNNCLCLCPCNLLTASRSLPNLDKHTESHVAFYTYICHVCQSSFLQLKKVHCVDMPPAVHPFLYLMDISAVFILSAFDHLNTYKFYHSITMFKKCFQSKINCTLSIHHHIDNVWNVKCKSSRMQS